MRYNVEMITKQQKLERHRISCRKYYKNNIEKVRESKKKWKEKNPEADKIYSRKYRKENKERVKAIVHKSYLKNRDKKLAYSKKYREENKEKTKIRHDRYRRNNKEKERVRHAKYREENRVKIYNSSKIYFENNINARLARKLRSRMKMALMKQGVNKSRKTYELVGCTLSKLKSHIEKQFIDGMTWDNHDLFGWHIDHIRPCKSFDLSNLEEQKKCFHYTNLQPLWASDNLSKGSKIIK